MSSRSTPPKLPAAAATPNKPSGPGFAALDEAQRSKIASIGGRAAHEQGQAHQFTSEEAQLAGRIGGKSVCRDRDHMAAIGRLGGFARAARNRD